MKKKVEVALVALSLLGILIEVMSHMFGDTFSFFRGIGLIRYYTIQSNSIVFGYFLLGFFEKYKSHPLYKKMLPGVVIYIAITFMVFALMLQGTFEITGIRIVGNYLVHYIVPIVAIVYLFVSGENQYTYKDISTWSIYPLLYIVFMLIYGAITSDYLYPFFDLNVISVWVLIITIIILVLLFMLLSFIVVKILSKKELTNN